MQPMIRAHVRLDEQTYRALRETAAGRGIAASALARELLARSLGTAPGSGRRRYVWTFVGMSRSRSSDGSLRHDDHLASGRRW